MVNQEDPRVLRTRQLIRAAFRDLLRRKGFEAITIKDIAQAATINRATFYAHFEDKYALLDEVTEQAFQAMIPQQVANAQEFTEEICDQLILLTHQYIVDFYRNCLTDSNPLATLIDDKIKKMLQHTLASIFLKRDRQQGTQGQSIQIMAAMTGAAIYGAAFYWFTVEKTEHADGLVDVVRPYVMNGLGLASPGR